MEFVDRQITCLDCNQPFVFTAGEQQFYEKKGFREEPKRCKACRDARKNRRVPAAPAGDVDDDNVGNRASASAQTTQSMRGPREVRDVRGKRELFDATCATCGTATRVPFKPTPGRPVYCRDCFATSGKGSVA
jgi:CxxC-x17-CxxC domain-containing protein